MKTISRLSCLLVLIASGCVGEASVTYKGTVVQADDATGFSFDPSPNPENRLPIPGAKVSVCVSTGECEGRETGLPTSGDGTWGPVEQVFGGFVGTDTNIEIRVTAMGYEPFVYRTVYETTQDPTNGQQFMNVRLRPKQ